MDAFDKNLDPDLLQKIFGLSKIIRSNFIYDGPITVRSSFQIGCNESNSGRFCFPEFQGRLFGLFLLAERFGFSNIGLIPDMVYDSKIVGGLHLDVRPIAPDVAGGRWIESDEFDNKERKKIVKFYPATIKNMKNFQIMR
jgi:hypothetical protein